MVVPQPAVGQYTQFALQPPQQQQQLQPGQAQNELSIWSMGTPTPIPNTQVNATKPGGIAKKVIDKQSRKDRRCFRQTPAGSQGMGI